ncbi:hypothetical protein NDK50_08215 [Paraburkholderia bryophila]|uniref:hypothetical protein n=1 Tax=Paraburkholderia bryophila TaxID=420952 RepID=UPI00234A58B3|nr:hypothetical protein [Paraburkholderia bryophila]WCM21421.1 hypothetical protein NDK50_08215 [Paraburkholderia bryophila]
MRVVDHIDSFAKRHRILMAIITAAIVAGILQFAHQLDQDNASMLRMQWVAGRSST